MRNQKKKKPYQTTVLLCWVETKTKVKSSSGRAFQKIPPQRDTHWNHVDLPHLCRLGNLSWHAFVDEPKLVASPISTYYNISFPRKLLSCKRTFCHLHIGLWICILASKILYEILYNIYVYIVIVIVEIGGVKEFGCASFGYSKIYFVHLSCWNNNKIIIIHSN